MPSRKTLMFNKSCCTVSHLGRSQELGILTSALKKSKAHFPIILYVRWLCKIKVHMGKFKKLRETLYSPGYRSGIHLLLPQLQELNNSSFIIEITVKLTFLPLKNPIFFYGFPPLPPRTICSFTVHRNVLQCLSSKGTLICLR